MGLVTTNIKSFYRKPTLWIGSILGLILAISLIIGGFMATDYAGTLTVTKAVNNVPCDYMLVASTNPINMTIQRVTALKEALAKKSYIDYADFLYRVYLPASKLVYDKESSEFGVYIMFGGYTIGNISIEGKIGGGVGIGYMLARVLGIGLGDNITISYLDSPTPINVTLKVTAIIRFSGRIYDAIYAQFYGYYFEAVGGILYTKEPLPEAEDPNYGVFFMYNESAFMDMVDRLNVTSKISNGEVLGFVGYKKDSLIDPMNVDDSLSKVRQIDEEVRVTAKNILRDVLIDDYSLIDYAFLSSELANVSMMLLAFKLGIIIQFFPVILLAVVLSLIADWILINNRRREIGLLKVRGASGKQIFVALLAEAVLAGIIGGFLGFVFAFAFAYGIIGEVSRYIGYSLAPSEYMQIWMSYWSSAVFLGVFLSAISIYYPASKISKLPTQEAIREYLPEIEGKVKVERFVKILFIMSLIGLIDILAGSPTLKFAFTWAQQGQIAMAFLVFLLLIFYMLTFTVGPFVLPYATAKIVAANADKLTGVLEHVSAVFSGDLKNIAVKQFVRKKARAYKVILLLILTLTFSLYGAINFATNESRMRVTNKITIGSDVKVYLTTGVPWNYTDFSELKDVDGVSQYARFGRVNVAINFMIVDPEYPKLVDWSSDYTERALSAQDVENILKTNDSVLVSAYYAYSEKVEVGDIISIAYHTAERDYILNFTVAGILNFAPGIASFLGPQVAEAFILGGRAIIESLGLTAITNGILVDVESGANATRVAENIKALLESEGFSVSIYVYELAIAQMERDWQYIYNRIFVNLIFVMSLIMASTGIALTMATSILERRRELSLLRVRGASLRNLAGIILGELAILLLLGVGMGLIMALTYSYWFLVSGSSIAWAFMGRPVVFPKEYIMTIPSYIFLAVAGFVGIMFVFSLIPLYVVYRSDISQELRRMGG